MGKVKDLTGNKYGKLTVICDSGERNIGRQVYWLCKCECGNTSKVVSQHLKSGATITCGKCKINTYYIHDDGYMVGLDLSGKEFYFDTKHFDIINQYNWFVKDNGYVITTSDVKGKKIRQHVLISQQNNKIKHGIEVDHINHFPNDNREHNLRISTHQQNMFNQKKRANATSRYKGVSFHSSTNKWRACIKHNYKQIYIGLFDDEKEAAKAYNRKAIELFGEFANLNNL